ncbi:MAG: ribosome silencing factor [Chlamydiae bacterium]|nr:ribosome silencing factor [Chlamydiota bacterium]MBI3266714.1 ribosome silencing factor [Chlamydiota bacterium]
MALECARVGHSKNGENILVLDIQDVSTVALYYVIVTGRVDKHVKAIANEIDEKLEEKGVSSYHRDSDRDSKWIVLDYWDVIVHVFDPATREYYQLEKLWGDAEEVKWDE